MMDWGKFFNDLKIFKIVFRVKNKNSYKSFFELYYIDQFEIIFFFFFVKIIIFFLYNITIDSCRDSCKEFLIIIISCYYSIK